jgi:hypothetical protein
VNITARSTAVLTPGIRTHRLTRSKCVHTLGRGASVAIEKTLKKETRMNINDKNARLSALKAKMQADSKRSFDGKKDREDFWQTPTGESTVRLLHHPNDESPVIPYYNHAFKEKEWFIEDCPLSIDLPCPVCEAGRKGHERKVYFVANVFVPDTWAIQWWKFGQQIFDVIEAGERGGVNPFDPIEGAHLMVVKPEYTRSRFVAASPLGTEDEIVKILARCRPLSAIVKLKPYSELKAKYERIAGAAVPKKK